MIADRAHLLDALITHAVSAGDVVWGHFRAGCSVRTKSDLSPVTAADHDAEAIILAGLAIDAPGVAVVAEEEHAAGRVPGAAATFFLVDPVDGTKDFVARGTDFTVNIGLIERGAPTMGVIYAPARDRLWWGDTTLGAWTATRVPGGTHDEAMPIRVASPGPALRAVASRMHDTPATERWLAAAGIAARVSVGSSLKFALVASGEADVYPRFTPTMEWDTAAGDAILRAAGGMTYGPDGLPFAYGKPGYLNAGFLATGGARPAGLDAGL
jgi:3'(2'), 5'-bisphosphate nucleotidase